MDRAYSVGAIVPASTFIYGSTLIEETCSAGQQFATPGLSHSYNRQHIFNPIVLSKSPVEEATEMSERLSSKRPGQVEDEVRTNYTFPDAAYDT